MDLGAGGATVAAGITAFAVTRGDGNEPSTGVTATTDAGPAQSDVAPAAVDRAQLAGRCLTVDSEFASDTAQISAIDLQSREVSPIAEIKGQPPRMMSSLAWIGDYVYYCSSDEGGGSARCGSLWPTAACTSCATLRAKQSRAAETH